MQLDDIKSPNPSSNVPPVVQERPAQPFINGLNWFFGILWVILGITGLFSPNGNFISGLFLLLTGLILLPPFRKLYLNMTDKHLTRGQKVAAACITFFLFVATVPKGESASKSTSTEVLKKINVPTSQTEFTQVIQNANSSYSTADNEFKKSKIRSERRSQIQSALSNKRVFKDWVGEITDMQTTSEGKGVLAIKLLDSNVVIKTWNNAISDIMSSSLIEQSDPLYNKLANLPKGQKVRVSGTFDDSPKDFIFESSLTEQGAMDRPEFIVKFKSVEINK